MGGRGTLTALRLGGLGDWSRRLRCSALAVTAAALRLGGIGHWSPRLCRLALAVAAAAAGGCLEGRTATAVATNALPPAPPPLDANQPAVGGRGGDGLTYWRDVAPIIKARCAGCHAPGAFAPFTLTSYADVDAHLGLIADEVDRGRMPPWAPSDACNQYLGDRSLSADERATVLRWASEGGVEGDPTDVGPPLPVPAGVALAHVDATLTMPVAYTPTLFPDEYRCFLLDWPATSDTFVTGYSVRPGNPAIVHHVVAFVAPANEVAALAAKEGQDGHPGYPCFGGAGAGSLSSAGRWLGIWAPGSQGTVYGSGVDTGLRIQPGSKIVLQMHYHVYASAPGAAGASVLTPDQSSIDLSLSPKVAQEGFMMPFGSPLWLLGSKSFMLPAGAPDTTMTFGFSPFPEWAVLYRTAPTQLTIHNVGLHMHALGTRASLKLTPSRGGSSTCLLDIPAWDFHWQDIYVLNKPVAVHRGDKITVECHYDNSAANQPAVNGVKAPPQTVYWGEKSSDEMCLGLFYITPS